MTSQAEFPDAIIQGPMAIIVQPSNGQLYTVHRTRGHKGVCLATRDGGAPGGSVVEMCSSAPTKVDSRPAYALHARRR